MGGEKYASWEKLTREELRAYLGFSILTSTTSLRARSCSKICSKTASMLVERQERIVKVTVKLKNQDEAYMHAWEICLIRFTHSTDHISNACVLYVCVCVSLHVCTRVLCIYACVCMHMSML